MKNEQNVFEELGLPDADLLLAKSDMCIEIGKLVRKLEEENIDISLILNAQLRALIGKGGYRLTLSELKKIRLDVMIYHTKYTKKD